MRLRTLMLPVLPLLALLAGCGDAALTPTAIAPTPAAVTTLVLPTSLSVPATPAPAGGNAGTTPAAIAATAGQPPHIVVQHILIGFQGSIPGKTITRSKDEAKTLAEKLFAEAKAGTDFDQLVKDNTDDRAPGIYALANAGVTLGSSKEYAREKMIPAFGDVGFKLQVGEIGLASYDATTSPYGWHIIKRLGALPTVVVPAGEAEHITVQHILIGFQGTIPGKNIVRTKDEAQALAEKLFAQAQAGSDFDQLVKDNTDDSPPGIYEMANLGVAPANADEAPRDQMIPAFGDVGFKLKPGEIGLAPYDPTASPYGWHIIKRLK
ncbi:MAG: peptidyl-prolyl cis-trans isomerase [Chloroflexota bacterium]|nr:peptidyl-prolyl cis-trans isomerase [Chloroflexota bacterium]